MDAQGLGLFVQLCGLNVLSALHDMHSGLRATAKQMAFVWAVGV